MCFGLLLLLVEVNVVYVHRNRRLAYQLGTVAQDGHLDFHTAPELSSSSSSSSSIIKTLTNWFAVVVVVVLFLFVCFVLFGGGGRG